MITSLQYVALGIPSMKVGVDFYEAFGLHAVEYPGYVALRCEGRAQDQMRLFETGRSRRLHHFSLGTSNAGLDSIAGKLDARGIGLLDPPNPGLQDGLWFRDPEGTLVNVQVSEPASHAGVSSAPVANRPGAINRHAQRGCPSFDMQARPRRLGHCIVFAKDVVAQSRFYAEVLGLRLSDRIADGYAAFLRTAGDSDHHVLAMLKSDAPGFHHASFEMDGVDEAEVAAMRLVSKGYRHAWGPGRHGVGSNYFHYFRDPWNGLAEYFHDMDFIPDDAAWEPQEWTKQSGMFLWSADGRPPPDFGHNYELD